MGFGWKDFFIGAALVAAAFIPGLNATVASMFLAGGLSFIGKAIPKPTLEQQRQGALVQGVSTQNAVRIVYGKARVAGQMVFQEAKGSSGDTPNAYLDMVGVLCTGSRTPQAGEAADPFDGIIGGVGPVWFDDYQAFKTEPLEVNLTDGYWKLDPDENLTSAAATGFLDVTFFSVAAMWAYLGGESQVANQHMIDRWGTDPRWPWTSDHRLRGMAYYVVSAFYRQVKFPRGVPNVTAYVEGRRCFDPRLNDGAGGWPFATNTNPSLCVRDYLLDEKSGGAVKLDQVGDPSFVKVADRCDEIVIEADGTSRRRHTMNGPVDTNRSVKTNVQDMLRCFQGFLAWEQGKFQLRQQDAEAEPVDLILDQSNIVGDWSFGTADVENRVNRVVGNYVDATVPSADLEVDTPLKDQIMQAPFPPNGDPNPYLDEDGGLDLTREVDFPFIDNFHECQAAAAAELTKSRAIVTAALTAYEDAMALGLADKVRIHHPRPDWNLKEFYVEGLGLLADQTVRVAVREVTPGADYGFPSSIPPTLESDPHPTLTFAAFCSVIHGKDNVDNPGFSEGTTGNRIRWTQPPPEDAEHTNWRVEIVAASCANFDPVSAFPGPGFDCGRQSSFVLDADDYPQPFQDDYSGFGGTIPCAQHFCDTTAAGIQKWYKARWVWNTGGGDVQGEWSPSFKGAGATSLRPIPATCSADYCINPDPDCPISV